MTAGTGISASDSIQTYYNYVADDIRTYLHDIHANPDSSAASIAAKLLDKDPDVEGYLWDLWGAVLHYIQHISHDHPWQDKLVRLTAAIKRLPAPPSCPHVQEFERTWGFKLWTMLPILGATMRESWNQGPWEKLPPEFEDFVLEKPFSQGTWASMNAYAARLTAASVANFESFASWILRHTLEEERLIEELEDNLPAATMWIRYAGTMTYHNAARADSIQSETHQSSGNYLRTFDRQFSSERWAYWKERLEVMSADERLTRDVKIFVDTALNHMAEIEHSDPRPTFELSARDELPQGRMHALPVVEGSLSDAKRHMYA